MRTANKRKLKAESEDDDFVPAAPSAKAVPTKSRFKGKGRTVKKEESDDDDDDNDDDDLLTRAAANASAAAALHPSAYANGHSAVVLPVATTTTIIRKQEAISTSTFNTTTLPVSAAIASTSNAIAASPSNKQKKSAASSDGAPTPKKARKAKEDKPVEEKRMGRYRASCPKNIEERLHRVMAQRFFLIGRERNGQDLQETFKVLGSTGNVYTIVVKHVPTCDCPDAKKGNHCKHLLFVMLKVLNVPQHSPHYYQKALLTNELAEVFANAPPNPQAQYQHAALNKALAKATGSPVKEGAEEEEAAGKRRLPEAEDTCPVCFEEFGEAPPMNELAFCEASCGGPIHKECLKQWLASAKPEPTCVYCRALWTGPEAANLRGRGGGAGGAANGAGPVMQEGYLNLAGAVGISGVRDTSSYYHGPVRGQTEARAYYNAVARYNGGAGFDEYGGDWGERGYDL